MATNPTEDRGLYAVWYDLGDRPGEHLSWLHEHYIPMLLQQDGIRWAAHYRREAGITKTKRPGLQTSDPAVPKGQDYIFIVGARDASVFGGMFPLLKNGASKEDELFIAQRQNARVSTATEIRKWMGPELPAYRDGETPGPCIQFGNYVCPLEHREGMVEWYATDWMLKFVPRQGVVRARTLSRVTGWASHLVLYEFLSLEARMTAFTPMMTESYVPNQSAAMLIHAPDSPSVATRIWPAPQ